MKWATRCSLAASSRWGVWRTTLAGVLIGFLVGQAMALTWLVSSQAEKAHQRKLLDAASRAEAAKCFGTGPSRADRTKPPSQPADVACQTVSTDALAKL